MDFSDDDPCVWLSARRADLNARNATEDALGGKAPNTILAANEQHFDWLFLRNVHVLDRSLGGGIADQLR